MALKKPVSPKPAGPKLGKAVKRHATYAPSTLGSRDICAGWANEKSDLFKMYSDEGTAMHEAAEKGDAEHLNDHELLAVINSGKMARMPAEQKDCVQRVLDYLKPLEDGAAFIHKEIRLGILPEWFVEFGTADRLIGRHADPLDAFDVTAFDLHIVDFKFGKTPVSPAYKNAQGQAYAIGGWNKYPAARSVTVHFHQPRVAEEVDRHKFYLGDLDALKLRVARISARVQLHEQKPDFKLLNPHFTNCNYCGKIGVCPAVANVAITQANAYSAAHDGEQALDLDPVDRPSFISDPNVLSRVRAAATILDKWSKSVKTAVTDLMTNGGHVPGYKLSHTDGTRVLDNGLLVWVAVQEWNEANPTEAFTVEELLSIVDGYSMTKLDALVKEKAGPNMKAKLLVKFNDAMSDSGAMKLTGGGFEVRRNRAEPIA